MTKRKIEIKKIENENYRKVTYSKRRAGLIKKAKFLCNSSNAQIAIVTFSLAGRLISFGHPSVDPVVDHFLDNHATGSGSSSSNDSSLDNVHRPPPPSSSSSKGVVAGKEGQPWWALPIEDLDLDLDLDLDRLRQYKASLEVLESNVANRLKEARRREALTRDFIGSLDTR